MKISYKLALVLAVSCIILVGILGIIAEEEIPSIHAANPVAWTQILGDEFNGASNSPVDSQWQFDQGTGWGNNQQEQDTNSTSNIYQDGNGNLVIKPINTNGSWTSGRIETTNDSLAAPVGGELQVTASIQLPDVSGAAAQGYWPAFWMLGAGIRSGGSWPNIGEIDAMENINGANMEYGTLHCGVSPGGPCNEGSGLGGSTACTMSTCQAGFHTYTVIVDRSASPEQIRWYLDGKEFWHVSSDTPGMDATTWQNAVDHSFFIILNVAIGGGWPGNATSSTQSGAGMKVDYVRAYSANGSASLSQPVTSATSASPVTTANSDPYMEFCSTFYQVTANSTPTGSTANYNNCQQLASQFKGYIQASNWTYGSTSTTEVDQQKNWPTTPLVVLSHPADRGIDIHNLPVEDISQTEDALTTYFQSHLSTDSTQKGKEQTAIDAWKSDPFLQQAFVTYNVDVSTQKATYINAEENDGTIMLVSNFLKQDTSEVQALQKDLEQSVQSTTYTKDGANCDIVSSTSALTQSYQDCLGTDTLVDILYAEHIANGNSSSTAYTNAVNIIENEYNSQIKAYIQANQSSDSGQKVQQAYNTIAAITDKKLRDTYIDHVITVVITSSLSTLVLVPSTTASPTQVPSGGGETSTPSGQSEMLPLALFKTLPTDTHTWYNAASNDPPGYDSYQHARGTGTYKNPITFAIAEHSPTFKQGDIIYIPELEKYFYAEDTCAACQQDLDQGHQDHIDLWTGEISNSCADSIKVPPTMYSNDTDPEPIHYLIISANNTVDQNYMVDTTPFTCG